MSHKNVYVGGTLCKNVYVGTQRVWTQATPLTYSGQGFATEPRTRNTITLTTSSLPIELYQHPERIKEVRLSTGLVLPHISAKTNWNQTLLTITLTDTLANLGVPPNTIAYLEIDYWPE